MALLETLKIEIEDLTKDLKFEDPENQETPPNNEAVSLSVHIDFIESKVEDDQEDHEPYTLIKELGFVEGKEGLITATIMLENRIFSDSQVVGFQKIKALTEAQRGLVHRANRFSPYSLATPFTVQYGDERGGQFDPYYMSFVGLVFTAFTNFRRTLE